MNGRAELLQLAAMIGIEARFTDALGQTREVPDQTLLALVAAFGLPSDAAQARCELDARESSTPFGLAAVHVIHAEDPRPELMLRLPASCREVAWTCRLEDGEQHSGRIAATSRQIALQLPSALPLGYHRLEVEAGNVAAQTDLIVAPKRCHLAAELGPEKRSWGLSCQLYGLR